MKNDISLVSLIYLTLKQHYKIFVVTNLKNIFLVSRLFLTGVEVTGFFTHRKIFVVSLYL